MPNPRGFQIGQRGAVTEESEVGPEFDFDTPTHVGTRGGTDTTFERTSGGEPILLPKPQEPVAPAWYYDRIYSRGRSPEGLAVVRYTLLPAVATQQIEGVSPIGPAQQIAGGFGNRKIWIHNNSGGGTAAAIVFGQTRHEVHNGVNVYPIGPGADFDIETEAPLWIGSASTVGNVDVLVVRTFWRKPIVTGDVR